MTTMQAQPHPARTISTAPAQYAAYGTGQSRAPTHDEIAHRAYDLYVSSGSEKGHCTRNWHLAEQELIQNSGSAPQAPMPPHR